MTATGTAQARGKSTFHLLILAILCTIPLVGIGVWWQGSSGSTRNPDDLPDIHYAGRIRAAAASNRVLVAGDQASLPVVQGWINPPDQNPTFGPGLTVLDFTSLWCPFCESTAPGMVELAKKVSGQNIQFLSFTIAEQKGLQQFVRDTGINWPVGYGVPLEYLAAHGAVDGFTPVPGYEVKPLLLVVDALGKVVWSDGHARHKHQAPEETVAQLEKALKEVSTPTGSGPTSPVLENTRKIQEADLLSRKVGIGDTVSLPTVTGWLNLVAPGPQLGPGLTVLDITALWCPYCRYSAPNMVEIANRVKDQPVRFITLTSNAGGQQLKEWLKETKLPWAVGFGVSLQDIAKLGSLDSKTPFLGQETKPNLLILDKDGKVLWTDNHARHRHEEPEILAQELESALQSALKTTQPSQ